MRSLALDAEVYPPILHLYADELSVLKRKDLKAGDVKCAAVEAEDSGDLGKRRAISEVR